MLFQKQQNLRIYAPVKGICKRLEDVKDEMFANKVLGDGFAIDTDDVTICSPVEGKIVMFSDSAYAFGIKTRGGYEVLTHVGIDTVYLKGQGFKALKHEGEKVKAGEPMIRLDLKTLKEHGCDLTTMVVVTSGQKVTEPVKVGQDVTIDDVIVTLA